MTIDDQRWQAVLARSQEGDRLFVYAVTTTGIFCKPSCRSRRPLREHVRFFSDVAATQNAGFRACLLCKPAAVDNRDRLTALVQEACTYLEKHIDEPPSYQYLSERAGLSPAYFHRSFKRAMGMTPRQYTAQLRIKKLKKTLRKGASVTDSIYTAGYGSSSRLYEKTDAELGMTPGEYKAGGHGIAITYVCLQTVAFGTMMIAATDRGLCFLQFGESEAALLVKLRGEFPLAVVNHRTEPPHPHFAPWIKEIQSYISGQASDLRLPLDLRATAFQMRVWQYLQQIPYGQVRSYSRIASDLGAPRATRAVAGACAANRVALLVPCHRVLRNNGDLGGFRWGLDRKRALLDMEAAGMAARPSAQS